MSTEQIPHPPIATETDWLSKRKELLAREKELTKQGDRVNAERRRLPMVKVGKDYVFHTPSGEKSLLDLFEGRRQLVIYHFMYGPDWETGCMGCTGFVDALGDISLLNDRDTTFTLVSRAQLEKLEAYKKEHGWDVNWVSAYGSDFNYDYHATHDSSVAPVEYNYMNAEELAKRRETDDVKGEDHAMSVFFRLGDDVYHTYSVFARGTEGITDSYSLLDITPYGRQEDFEESPAGWPQKPTYG